MAFRHTVPVFGLLFGFALSAEAADEAKKPNAAPLSFEIRERGPRLPWRMSIENVSDAPVRLVADPRLLSFEVEVPGKKKKERCHLPAGLVPSRPDARTYVVLGPGEGVVHHFDPRLYCFAAGGQWRLVPGAFIRPKFGWPKKTKTVWKHGKKHKEVVEQKPPFVAQTFDGETDEIDEDSGGTKELSGQGFALRSEYARWAKTRLEQDRSRVDKVPIGMRLTQGSDARAEINASISLSLKNRSKRTQRIYFRRELVSFEVMGPDGLVTCDAQPDLRSPDPQAFLTLRAGRSMAITSRLVELCPRGAFARPGLYLVHARLDAAVDGNDFGIDAYTGRVVSELPATVRIRTGDQPFLRKRSMRRMRGPGARRGPGR
jgi:hypothetical protein